MLHLPRRASRFAASFWPSSVRHYGSEQKALAVLRLSRVKKIPKTYVKSSNPISSQLLDTGVWTQGRSHKSEDGDSARVNIVSEELCDQIVDYIKPSLERHVGCDIVDISPGAGVWSRALNKALRPRNHLLFEPDAELYRPFLQPLLDDGNGQLIPKAGYDWPAVEKAFAQYLPHQRRIAEEPGYCPRRNDTLLLTGTICWYPSRRVAASSLAKLVVIQLATSLQLSSLFQKYGMVRMLLWLDPHDGIVLVPFSTRTRTWVSILTELGCQSASMVADQDHSAAGHLAQQTRDEWMDLESARRAVARMDTAGLIMPPGRETMLYKRVREEMADPTEHLAGVRAPIIHEHQESALEAQQKKDDRLNLTKPSERLAFLRRLKLLRIKHASQFLSVWKEYTEVVKMYEDENLELAREMDAMWNAKLASFNISTRSTLDSYLSSLQAFRQDPPLLMWDRRPYEPLAVRGEDFFPQVPMSLVDLQPRPMQDVFRDVGPGSQRTGELFSLLIGRMVQSGNVPLSKALERIWPGSSTITVACSSLRDPAYGGSPVSSGGEIVPRVLNESQWADLLRQWARWPFRPSYEEMLFDCGESSSLHASISSANLSVSPNKRKW